MESGMPLASILCNKLTTLTYLEVDDVEGLTSLPEVTLRNNKNLEFLSISKCPKLRYLSDGLLPLSLKELDIRDCSSLASIPIVPEQGGLPSLRLLVMAECSQLSSLPDGLQYCTSLQTLGIYSCPKITSIPAQYCTSLQCLDVRSCPKITSISAQYCTSLQEFRIASCPKITSIRIPSEGLPSLAELELWECPELSSLPSGLGCCTSLVNLRVTGCPKVLPQLDFLTIDGWPKIKSLPEQIQHLTSLTYLRIADFEGVEAIPEWLGNLASISSHLRYFPLQESDVSTFRPSYASHEIRMATYLLLSPFERKMHRGEWHRVA
ncbi:uncharacterized protein LOC133716078 [Rosa rugosa]|uniref:uncharacterized protein LOC133716078 n=1 Tax=Rosa rugosa TaxID=74645 RepID=UPI002B400ED3|nr:uncharacterized protein LOC133716078 [Rosa rugosa]